MNASFKKIMSLFFEKAERRVKPLMYAQLTFSIIALISGYLVAINKINNFAIMYFMLGTSFLLIGIENLIINKKKRRDYIIWFISALCFYSIAIDYILH